MKMNIQLFAGIVDYDAAQVNALNQKVTATRETLEGNISSIKNHLNDLTEKWYNPRGKGYGDGFQANLNEFINGFNSYINSFGEAVAQAGQNYANTMEGDPVNSFSSANIGNVNVAFVSEKGGRQGGDDTAGAAFQSAAQPDLQSITQAISELTNFTNGSTAFDEPTMSSLRSTVSSCNGKASEIAEMTVEDFIQAGMSSDESLAGVQSGTQNSFSGGSSGGGGGSSATVVRPANGEIEGMPSRDGDSGMIKN